MLRGGLKSALAGQVDEEPEGCLDAAPGEEKATECIMRRNGDTKGDPEYAERCDCAESKDDQPNEHVPGERVVEHAANGAPQLRRLEWGVNYELIIRDSTVVSCSEKAQESLVWRGHDGCDGD